MSCLMYPRIICVMASPIPRWQSTLIPTLRNIRIIQSFVSVFWKGYIYIKHLYHSYLSDKFLIACHIQSIGSIDETFPCPMVIILFLCLFLISFNWIGVLKVRFPYLWMFNFYKIFYSHRWRFGWRQCRPSRQTSTKANSHSKSSWLQLWHFQQ